MNYETGKFVVILIDAIVSFVIIIIHINQEEAGDDSNTEKEAVIRLWSGFAWLIGTTLVIALLSEYLVQTIEVIN